MSTIDAQSELIEGRWGTHPTEKRKAELEEMLRGWEASSNYSNRRNPFDGKRKAWSNEAWSNHDNRRGPFDGKVLSGSDVFWLAIHLARSTNKVEVERLVRAPLAPPVNTSEYVDLSMLNLEGADLRKARLQGAYLIGAHLQEAILNNAHLEDAELPRAHLQGAILVGAHLEGARLYRADLREADLTTAHLGGAISRTGDVVPPATLRSTTFDARTNLAGVTLGDIEHGFVSVVDTAWNGVNLATVDWGALCSSQGMLGDEQRARNPTAEDGKPKTLERTLFEYQEAVRAYRQLSVVLQAQGLIEQSMWLGYRGQMLQHAVLTLQLASFCQTPRQGAWQRRALEVGRLWGRVLFSRALDRVAGYGYKPGKSVTSYLSVQGIFIALYLLIGLQNFVTTGHHLPGGNTPLQAAWTALLEAGILSVTSFHGRAFLPGSTGNFVNNVPLPTTLMFGGAAAVEAVIGLLIEAILVATLIQRFFR